MSKVNKNTGQSFRDIKAWQKARHLRVEIYGLLQNNKDFSFRDQIQRASVSIMNNIAEGHSRRSPKAFSNFLLIAKGSAAEVESMLELGRSLEYFKTEDYYRLVENTDEISKILSGLLKSLKTQNSKIRTQ
ncbi:MAG: four helix bundle protein [Candidatus Saccharibacteria bacterium]|nr:four helix bundle protein [Candidatus Saccharibacteria bacterium]